MTWGTRKLNDGRELPEIGFGTWKVGSGQTVVDQVEQAIEVGFDHIGEPAAALPELGSSATPLNRLLTGDCPTPLFSANRYRSSVPQSG